MDTNDKDALDYLSQDPNRGILQNLLSGFKTGVNRFRAGFSGEIGPERAQALGMPQFASMPISALSELMQGYSPQAQNMRNLQEQNIQSQISERGATTNLRNAQAAQLPLLRQKVQSLAGKDLDSFIKEMQLKIKAYGPVGELVNPDEYNRDNTLLNDALQRRAQSVGVSTKQKPKSSSKPQSNSTELVEVVDTLDPNPKTNRHKYPRYLLSQPAYKRFKPVGE